MERNWGQWALKPQTWQWRCHHGDRFFSLSSPSCYLAKPFQIPNQKKNMEKLQELFQATNFRHSFVTWKQTTKTEICGVRIGSESRPEGAQGDLLVEPGLTEDVVIGSWKKDPRYVKLSVKTVTCSNMESTKGGPGYRVFQHKCW